MCLPGSTRNETRAAGPRSLDSPSRWLRCGICCPSFVTDVFASTRFDQQILLRGVYFTSGTQEGTPIDRLLGAIGRRFAVAPEAVIAPPGRGKAYFIERLLKEVMFAESGLAGVNRRFEFQKAAAQLGLQGWRCSQRLASSFFGSATARTGRT